MRDDIHSEEIVVEHEGSINKSHIVTSAEKRPPPDLSAFPAEPQEKISESRPNHQGVSREVLCSVMRSILWIQFESALGAQ
jgi:hypothetical protein